MTLLLAWFAGNLTLPTVYLKRDVVNVKLKRVQTENGVGWDARDYPQAVAHFYNGGPSTLTGKILQNPQNGIEKVARIDRLTKIINLE